MAAVSSTNQAQRSLSPSQDAPISALPKGDHCNINTTDTSIAETPTADATTTYTAAAFEADNGRVKPKKY